MNTKMSHYCLIMARSFINEFILTQNLDKKRHALVYELNKKLSNELKLIVNSHAQLETKAKESAEFVLDKLQGYVRTLNPENEDIEANNLAFGLNFLFLLVEHNYFKGSKMMYFKRVSNELHSICEREEKKLAIRNANKLVKMFDEEINA